MEGLLQIAIIIPLGRPLWPNLRPLAACLLRLYYYRFIITPTIAIATMDGRGRSAFEFYMEIWLSSLTRFFLGRRHTNRYLIKFYWPCHPGNSSQPIVCLLRLLAR